MTEAALGTQVDAGAPHAGAAHGVAAGADRTRTYGWHDPMALADVVAGLSGLELFEKLANGELPVPPIADTLSFGRIEATGAGNVTLHLDPREFHFNPIGSMHGGV